MKENFDFDGMELLNLAIVSQAREDYIDGYVTMIDNFGKVINEDEYLIWWNKNHLKKTREVKLNTFLLIKEKIEARYSAVKFLKEDPYKVFNMGYDKVIHAWDELAKEEYAKVLEQRALD